MLEAALRPNFDRFLVIPLVSLLVKFHSISPNTVTFLGGIFGLLVLPLLFFQQNIAAVFVLLLSGYFDVLDGALARKLGKSSSQGAMYDICTDRIVESSVIIGLFLVEPHSHALLCLLMLSSTLICVTSFLVAGILHQTSADKSFYYSPGLMERAEAFIFFIAMILLPWAFTSLAIIYCVLVLWTAVQRMITE